MIAYRASAMLLLAAVLAGRAAEPPPVTPETPATMETSRFSFTHQGVSLLGLLDRPTGTASGYAVLLVHGHGRSNVVKYDAYRTMRAAFTRAGLVCFTWDKPGCGASEGEYDRDQTFQSSADEVVAAARALVSEGVVGAGRVGVWGISRAGWINALAIHAAPDTAFWISVSAAGEDDNYSYLLRQNLKAEGRSDDYIATVLGEIEEGFRLLAAGEPYERYLAATRTWHADAFVARFCAGGPQSEEDYQREQRKHREGAYAPPPVSFRMVVAGVRCPVLAMFGENDLVVDWRTAAGFYRECLGEQGNLTLQAYPGLDHGLVPCATGTLREINQRRSHEMAPACLDAMVGWLAERGFANQAPR